MYNGIYREPLRPGVRKEERNMAGPVESTEQRERREQMESATARSVGRQYNDPPEQAASIPVQVQALVLGNVREASALLLRAHSAAIGRNPMSADVPAFQELTTIAKRLNVLMQEISKVRGL